MRRRRQYYTFRLVYCSIIAAISAGLMLVASVIPFGKYAAPVISGLLLISIVIEYGWEWAMAAYSVVGVLALLLSSNKEPALYFVVLFGYYPAIKALLEQKIKSRGKRTAVKLLIFNAAAILGYFAATRLLMIPEDALAICGFFNPWVFLLAGNVLFLLYDMAIVVYVRLYVRQFRDRVFRYFR